MNHPRTTDTSRPDILLLMTDQQRFDTIAAAGHEPSQAVGFQPGGQVARRNDREQFLARFRAPSQSVTEFQAGIPQAPTMMNGPVVAELTDPKTSPLLVSLSAPFLEDEERLNILFLSTLARFPREEERARFLSHIVQSSDDAERQQALSDVLWALLNSAEFVLNH